MIIITSIKSLVVYYSCKQDHFRTSVKLRKLMKRSNLQERISNFNLSNFDIYSYGLYYKTYNGRNLWIFVIS